MLKIWRHYLYGARFEVFSDHKSLKYLFDQKRLNMRQQRWLEYLKDSDSTFSYHLGKSNVVVDTLTRKSFHMFALMSMSLGMLKIASSLLDDIRVGQQMAHFLSRQVEAITQGKISSFEVGSYGVIGLQDKVCVPSIPRRCTKILKECFGGLKWDNISMDFVSTLPKTQKNTNSIWVIVDKLTKSTYYILVNVKYSLEKLTNLYIQEIGNSHQALGTKLRFIIHRQTTKSTRLDEIVPAKRILSRLTPSQPDEVDSRSKSSHLRLELCWLDEANSVMPTLSSAIECQLCMSTLVEPTPQVDSVSESYLDADFKEDADSKAHADSYLDADVKPDVDSKCRLPFVRIHLASKTDFTPAISNDHYGKEALGNSWQRERERK
ncbi:hypothetical protein CR513_29745, partial [Mucuna pruriens]